MKVTGYAPTSVWITGQPSPLTKEAIANRELLVFPYAALAGLFAASPTTERFGGLVSDYLMYWS